MCILNTIGKLSDSIKQTGRAYFRVNSIVNLLSKIYRCRAKAGICKILGKFTWNQFSGGLEKRR
jgi:hypothetical protein